MQENPVLSGESIKLMYTPQSKKIGIYGLIFEAYGFGHYIEKLPNGMLSISHGGQGNGIMTHLQAVPGRRRYRASHKQPAKLAVYRPCFK